MKRRIRQAFEQLRGQKHYKFEDLDPFIRKCLRVYRDLFPQQLINNKGNRYVYHFNVEGLHPISLEKQHGSREYIPPYFARLAMLGIEEMVAYIELHAIEEPEAGDERVAELAAAASGPVELDAERTLDDANPDDGDAGERDTHEKLE